MKKSKLFGAIIMTVMLLQFGYAFTFSTANAENYVSVKDYGAAGDGVTDDTAAFVKALEAANGRTVHIPGGTYVVNGGVVTHGIDINIVGEDMPMLQLVTSVSNKRCLEIHDANSISIKGVAFDGYRETYGEDGNLACVYIFDSSNVRIEGCHFQNVYKEGITLTSSKGVGNNLLENVVVTGNTFYNTSDNVWVKCRVKGFEFSNNRSELSRGTGVEFISGEFSEDIVVKDNTFINFNNGNAVKLIDTKNVEIRNNIIEDCLWGVRILLSDMLKPEGYTCENITIAENTFVDKDSERVKCEPIAVITSSKFDASRYLYNNIEVSSNVIDTPKGMTFSYTDVISIHDNKIKTGEDYNVYTFNYCNNVNIYNEAPEKVNKSLIMSNNVNSFYFEKLDYGWKPFMYVSAGISTLYVSNMQMSF